MDSQVLDRHTTKDVLRAVLHSILFHRLFGTIKSKTYDVLDVTMVRVPVENLKASGTQVRISLLWTILRS